MLVDYIPKMRSVDLQQSFAERPPIESRTMNQIESCTDSAMLNEAMSGMNPISPVLLRHTIDCGWDCVSSKPSNGPIVNTFEPNFKDRRYQVHEDLRSHLPLRQYCCNAHLCVGERILIVESV